MEKKKDYLNGTLLSLPPPSLLSLPPPSSPSYLEKFTNGIIYVSMGSTHNITSEQTEVLAAGLKIYSEKNSMHVIWARADK
jgi:hypothetical protein